MLLSLCSECLIWKAICAKYCVDSVALEIKDRGSKPFGKLKTFVDGGEYNQGRIHEQNYDTVRAIWIHVRLETGEEQVP